MIMNTLAWKYPDWNFHIFGIDPTIPVYCDNLKYYGWISEDEMDEIDKNFMVCFRFNLHDGFSQTVMKARMRGQAVITAISYKETNYYKSFDQLCDYFKNTDFLNFNPIEHSHFTNFDFII